MRRELCVVVLILAASKAADHKVFPARHSRDSCKSAHTHVPQVRWVQVVTDATTTEDFQTVCMWLKLKDETGAVSRLSLGEALSDKRDRRCSR